MIFSDDFLLICSRIVADVLDAVIMTVSMA